MADSDINKYTIEFLSFNWLITVACVVGLIFLVILVGRNISERKKLAYAKFLSVIMIIFFLANHIFLFYIGKWELSKELPIHLCSISGLICCVILFIPTMTSPFIVVRITTIK